MKKIIKRVLISNTSRAGDNFDDLKRWVVVQELFAVRSGRDTTQSLLLNVRWNTIEYFVREQVTLEELVADLGKKYPEYEVVLIEEWWWSNFQFWICRNFGGWKLW